MTNGLTDFLRIEKKVVTKQKDVFIVGGGNSAGQAAMYLSKFARQVNVLIRRDSLSYTMSSYLIDQIKNVNNISVCTSREVIEARGNERLQQLVIKNIETGDILKVLTVK